MFGGHYAPRRQPDVVLVGKRKDLNRAFLVQFARESNKDDKAGMSSVEQALADAKVITPDLMSVFAPSDDGDLLAPANRDFQRRFFREVVGEADARALMTKDGGISQAGILRMRNAVFAYVFGGAGDALEKMAESPDSSIKNLTTGMLKAAGAWADMRNRIAGGVLHPVDLTPDLAEAVSRLNALREEGVTVDFWLNQIGLFGPGISQPGKTLLKELDRRKRSPNRVAELLRAITQAPGIPFLRCGLPRPVASAAKLKTEGVTQGTLPFLDGSGRFR